MGLSDITRRDLIRLGLVSVAGASASSFMLPQLALAEEGNGNVVYLDEGNNSEIRKNSEFARAKWNEAVKKAEALGAEVITQDPEALMQPNDLLRTIQGFSQIRDVYDFSIFFYGVIEFPIEFWCTYDRQYVGSFWTFQDVYGVGASGTTTMYPVDVLYCSYTLINAHDSTLAAQYSLRLRGTSPIGDYFELVQAFYVEFYAYSQTLKVFVP